jgi:hypothetical protein
VATSSSSPSGNSSGAASSLQSRVEGLETEVLRLKEAIRKLAAAVGESDPL